MSSLPPITVFDVETTGLDPRRGHRIIEIAGVRVEDGKVLKDVHFVSMVNPERGIPWEAKQVNKISDEDVKGAPTIDLVLPQFLEFAAGTTLVAHNATFDVGFLESEKQYCWGYTDLPECLCTLTLSRNLYPREFRHSLDVLCARFGLIATVSRHRALTDVLLTAEALTKMLEFGNIRSMDELRMRAGVKQLTK